MSHTPPTDAHFWERVISHPPTVSPDALLMDIVTLMSQAEPTDLACVLVVTNAQPIGIITPQDVIRWVAGGTDLTTPLVAQGLPHQPITLRIEDLSDLPGVLRLLHQHDLRHLPIVDSQHHLIGLVTLDALQAQLHQRAQDICQALQACLQESEDRFRMIADCAPMLLWMAEPDGLCNFVNRGWLSFTGRELEQEMGNGWTSSLHPDDAEQCLHTYLTAIHAHQPFMMEYRLRRADGTYTWMLETGIPRFLPDGSLVGYVGTCVDISDRKHTEATFQQAKVNLEQQVEARMTELQQANQQLQQEIAERKRLEQVLQESQTCLQLFNSISTRITTGMSAENVIEATVKQLSQHFKTLRVIYTSIDPVGRMCTLYSVNPPNMAPIIPDLRPDLSVIDPDFLDRLRQLQPVVAEDVWQQPFSDEFRNILLLEGTRALLDIPLQQAQSLVGILSFESPVPYRWSEYEVATLMEIGDYLSLILQEAYAQQERQRIEVALLESQQENALLATALENAGDAIEIMNAQMVIEHINPAWEAITGYTRAEAIGNKPAALLHSSQHPDAFYQDIEATLASGQIWRGNIVARCKDGTLCHQETTIAPVLNASNQIEHYVAVKRDVTERKRVEESLRLTQFSLDHAVDAAFWIRPNGGFAYVNQAACRSLDYSDSELLLLSIRDITPHLTKAKWATCWKALKRQKSLSFESFHQTRQGHHFPVEITMNYLKFNSGEYGFAFARDATKRRQAEEALRLRDQAITASGSGVVIVDARVPALPIISVNPAFEKLTGYVEAEVLGKNCRFLQGEDREQAAIATLRTAIQNQQDCTVALRNYRKDGSLFWNELSIAPIYDFQGKLTHFVGIQKDISERRQAEEHLKASLYEKELLLKEVHHRVKNNLQVISSIFSLQSQNVHDPITLSILAESQNRIRSMALIHEKLYQSDSLSKIDFADYIHSLVKNLFSSYNVSSNLIQLRLNVSDIALTIDAAIPCGLLLNELVSNSLKHAFPHQRSGEINVDFSLTPPEQLQLLVQDNGIGLPEDWNIQQSNSLGLRLIQALTRQLNGTLEVESNGGARFQITFPKPTERKSF